MTEQTQIPDRAPSRWQRFAAALPTGLALLLIGLVWLAGAVWSFEEQTRFADANGFETPELLPLVLDGMAVAMAAVAWAASLDARPAVFARIGTAVAIGASSASNGSWAWTRSAHDMQTVVLAAGVPVVAMLAFEVLLAEVRRQVLRRRGQPGPVAITYPRLVRVVLAPWPTFTTWRRLVLAATDPAKSFEERPVLRAELAAEDDPGIRLCRQLEREMTGARQALAPGVARLALADRALPVRSPEPPRPVHSEPLPAPPAEPTREPAHDSPRPAAAAQQPAQRRVTERLTKPAQTGDDKKLRQAHTRLTRKLGREPTGQELGDAAGVSKATANRWKNAQKETQ